MFVCINILYEWDAAFILGYNTVGNGKGIYRQGKTGWRRRPPQQLQGSDDCLAGSGRPSFIGSGNSLYNSTSVSCIQTVQSVSARSASVLPGVKERLLPVWEHCARSSGRPAQRWWPPWHWFQNMGCCSYSDTKPVLVWLLPEMQRPQSIFNWRKNLCGIQTETQGNGKEEKQPDQFTCLFSKSILLPSTTNGKFSGSRGLAWIKNSSLQLSRVLKVLGAVTSNTNTQQSAPR